MIFLNKSSLFGYYWPIYWFLDQNFVFFGTNLNWGFRNFVFWINRVALFDCLGDGLLIVLLLWINF